MSTRGVEAGVAFPALQLGKQVQSVVEFFERRRDGYVNGIILSMHTICVFGDSIVHGFTDAEKGGWVARVSAAQWAKGNDDVVVYNLGIPGDTSTSLLARFDSDVGPRTPDRIIFSIGTNDSMYHAKLLAPETPPMAFEGNLRTLFEKALTICPQVYALGLLGCDESRTVPMVDTAASFYAARMGEYNAHIEVIAAEKGVSFIPMLHLVPPEHFLDGLHPDAAGHQLIAERVASAVFS